MKNSIFWDITPYSLEKSTISEEYAASISRADFHRITWCYTPEVTVLSARIIPYKYTINVFFNTFPSSLFTTTVPANNI
jgi:hypothetical protein